MPTTTIRKRLLCVEDFLSAVATGGAALEDFADKLAALADDVEHAIASSLLDEDTMSLAATIFLRVEILASSFQDILETTSSLEASMKGELEDTFARLSVDSDECETDPLLQHLPEGVSYWPSSVPLRPSSRASSERSETPSLISDASSEHSDNGDEDAIPLLGKRYFTPYDTDHFAPHYKKRRRPTPATSDDASTWIPSGRDAAVALEEPSIKMQTQCHASRKIKPLPPCRCSSLSPNPHLPSRPRKRRLSSTGTDRPEKRPRAVGQEPRGHIVSNPLPLAHNTSENQPLDIDKWAEMLTVDTYTPPDPSVPLEFDYTGLKRSTTAETMACGFASAAADYLLNDVFEDIMTTFATDGVHSTMNDTVAPAIVDEVTVASGSHSLGEVACLPPTSESGIEHFIPPVAEDAVLTSFAVTASFASPLTLDSDLVTCHSDRLSNTSLPDLQAAMYAAQPGTDRSRSPSPLEVPPPSFEDATATCCLENDPPSYTDIDQNPQTGCYSPPPPYYRPSEETRTFAHCALFKANTVFADLVLDTKLGIAKPFHLHAQNPQASYAIAV